MVWTPLREHSEEGASDFLIFVRKFLVSFIGMVGESSLQAADPFVIPQGESDLILGIGGSAAPHPHQGVLH